MYLSSVLMLYVCEPAVEKLVVTGVTRIPIPVGVHADSQRQPASTGADLNTVSPHVHRKRQAAGSVDPLRLRVVVTPVIFVRFVQQTGIYILLIPLTPTDGPQSLQPRSFC